MQQHFTHYFLLSFSVSASSDDVFHPEHRSSVEQRIPVLIENPDAQRPLRPRSGKYCGYLCALWIVNVAIEKAAEKSF